MKLFWTPASPFVRKVMVTLNELGIVDRVEIVPTRWPHSWATKTVDFAPDFIAATPVARIPALVTDDGLHLVDSSVICDWLNEELGGGRLVPADKAARWRMRARLALANNLLEAQIARRAETLRHPPERSDDFIGKMADRARRCFAELDATVSDAPIDLAQIAVGCACGFDDFRYPQDRWRETAPRLAAWYEAFRQRPSMQATGPAETPQ
jgi:glutathione S-transferase